MGPKYEFEPISDVPPSLASSIDLKRRNYRRGSYAFFVLASLILILGVAMKLFGSHDSGFQSMIRLAVITLVMGVIFLSLGRRSRPIYLTAVGFSIPINSRVTIERKWVDVVEFGLNDFAQPWIRVHDQILAFNPHHFEDNNLLAHFIVSHLPENVPVKNISTYSVPGKQYLDTFKAYGRDLLKEQEERKSGRM